MNRIAGLPNSDSNRAFDMFLKTRYLLEQTRGRVVFATGTPLSNTMAEMYTMLRYLAPGSLKESDVDHFDAWAANFPAPHPIDTSRSCSAGPRFTVTTGLNSRP